MDRRDYDDRREYNRTRRDDRDVFRTRLREDEQHFESTRRSSYNTDHTSSDRDRPLSFPTLDTGNDFRQTELTGLPSFSPQLMGNFGVPTNPDMPVMAYQLQLMELMQSMNPAIIKPSCSLYPPNNQSLVTPQREKPIGCKTIFVTGLPEGADNEMISEIFFPCGAIESISIKKSLVNKNDFCHVRFADRASVDQAVLFNGFDIVASRGDRRRYTLAVQYALDKNTKRDRLEFEVEERERYRKIDDQLKAQVSEGEPPSKQRRFTEYEASCLLDTLKNNNSKFLESVSVVNMWVEKGSINRKNADNIYNLVSSVNSHVKRLVREKKEHEELIEMQKFEQVRRAKEIKEQLNAVDGLFEKIGMKKAWDHFTKAQRRNLTQWKQQAKSIFKEIGLTNEASIEDRIEVGMELDDDDAVQSSASSAEFAAQQGYYTMQDEYPTRLTESSISQSDNAPTYSGYVDSSNGQSRQDTVLPQDVDYFQQLKNPKVDSEAENKLKDLTHENNKLQAQVSCLKALVEQNTNLAMQLQVYKRDAELAKQEFNSAVQSREQKISQLNCALHGLKVYLFNGGLSQKFIDGAPLDVGVTVGKEQSKTGTDSTRETSTASAENNIQETTTEPSGEDLERKDEVTPADSSSELEHQSSSSVHLSGKELAQVGIICAYLSICAEGATEHDIIRHLELMSCKVTTENVKKLLESLPYLFTCLDQEENQETEKNLWSFCGAQSVRL